VDFPGGSVGGSPLYALDVSPVEHKAEDLALDEANPLAPFSFVGDGGGLLKTGLDVDLRALRFDFSDRYQHCLACAEAGRAVGSDQLLLVGEHVGHRLVQLALVVGALLLYELVSGHSPPS
jgi:hypothetical protein